MATALNSVYTTLKHRMISKRCATYFSIIFSQLRNFVEEFKKGMKFLFFLILMRGIKGISPLSLQNE